VVHPSLLAQLTLVAWIRRFPEVRVHLLRRVDALAQAHLERYSAVLLYFHVSSISDASLASLDTYVTQGGGLIAIHSAAASFKEASAYSAILGGRLLRHGAVAPFSIRQTSVDGRFAGGGSAPERLAGSPARTPPSPLAPDFHRAEPFTVRDELYVHEYDPDNYVHFVADTDDGPEPMVWSRLHGHGRVFYFAPGHRAETLRHLAVRRILREGIRWAMKQEPSE
jgi:type 1 glutamine amidotransferase